MDTDWKEQNELDEQLRKKIRLENEEKDRRDNLGRKRAGHIKKSKTFWTVILAGVAIYLFYRFLPDEEYDLDSNIARYVTVTVITIAFVYVMNLIWSKDRSHHYDSN